MAVIVKSQDHQNVLELEAKKTISKEANQRKSVIYVQYASWGPEIHTNRKLMPVVLVILCFLRPPDQWNPTETSSSGNISRNKRWGMIPWVPGLKGKRNQPISNFFFQLPGGRTLSICSLARHMPGHSQPFTSQHRWPAY